MFGLLPWLLATGADSRYSGLFLVGAISQGVACLIPLVFRSSKHIYRVMALAALLIATVYTMGIGAMLIFRPAIMLNFTFAGVVAQYQLSLITCTSIFHYAVGDMITIRMIYLLLDLYRLNIRRYYWIYLLAILYNPIGVFMALCVVLARDPTLARLKISP